MFISKMYPHFDKLLYIFCIQNSVGSYSSFDFVYKMYSYLQKNVVMWYTYYIHTSSAVEKTLEILPLLFLIRLVRLPLKNIEVLFLI